MPAPSIDEAVRRLAARQHGVVTRRQLIAIGVGPDTVDYRLGRGRLRRLFRGVYVAGPVTPPLARPMAACLACGPQAVLSHRSAAALWALLDPGRRGSHIELIAPTRRRRADGIRVYRHGTLLADEVARHRGVPVTAPARTLFDLASILRPESLERAAGEAVARGLTSPQELATTLERHRGRTGIGTLREVLGRGGPVFTRSEAEALFLALIRRADVEPPEVNVVIAGHELDFYWPGRRLAVEVHGTAFHSSTRAFERDRRRDAELVAAGIRVMRVTWRQLTRRPEAVLVRLGGALSAASTPAAPLYPNSARTPK